jgi:hypothetical protein
VAFFHFCPFTRKAARERGPILPIHAQKRRANGAHSAHSRAKAARERGPLEESLVSKEEIIATVKECAARMGHTPSVAEFRKNTRVSKNDIRTTFGSYKRLLLASKLERGGGGYIVSLESLFLDWATVARKLGKAPAMVEYELHGKYSVRPLTRRYNGWTGVAAGMREYAIEHGLQKKWKDVLAMVADYAPKLKSKRTRVRTKPLSSRPEILDDRAVYGEPLNIPFSYAPTNEQGVLFVFGCLAKELGFSITRVQTAFPDVEAMRKVGPNRWQRLRIELENESRNFLTHMHPLDGCDAIVCWTHNWPECPLEVIELRKVIEDLKNREPAGTTCPECQKRRDRE